MAQDLGRCFKFRRLLPAMTHHVLLTGFEPFDQDPLNPSWEVARALDRWQPAVMGRAGDAFEVRAAQLPCVFGDAVVRLQATIAQWQPVLVICLGLAGGRSEITPERVAINVDDARIPDNAGRQPVDTAVQLQGPTAYFSTLPIKAMVRNLRTEGIPASVSNTAGTFVCNHVFYALMHHLAQATTKDGRPQAREARGGFIHVPALPELAARHPGMPSMALATQVRGLQVAIETALSVADDVREVGGALH
jgi:pyroglutamyl-peptidase